VEKPFGEKVIKGSKFELGQASLERGSRGAERVIKRDSQHQAVRI
jgi:hypothetical protein